MAFPLTPPSPLFPGNMGKEGTNWQDLIISKRRNCKIPNFQHLTLTIFKFPSSDTSFNLHFATISFVAQKNQILETIFLNHIFKKINVYNLSSPKMSMVLAFWPVLKFKFPGASSTPSISCAFFCLRGVQNKDIGGCHPICLLFPRPSSVSLMVPLCMCVCVCVCVCIHIYIVCR